MTPAERILWQEVRAGRLLNAKFRRQHVIAGYIVDFYCPTARLVVEVDGGIHARQAQEDAEREAALTAFGIQVMRVSNDAVEADMPGVLRAIAAALTPQPPLPEGEGE